MEAEEKKGGENEAYEENGVYKTLFGHQEVCLGMELTDDFKFIASCDTLKKLTVSTFPNVFNLQSVLLEHDFEIIQMATLGNDKVATLGASDGT